MHFYGYKIACRKVAFKAAKLGESVFAGQSDILTPKVATAGTFRIWKMSNVTRICISSIRMRLKVARVNTMHTYNKKLTRIV